MIKYTYVCDVCGKEEENISGSLSLNGLVKCDTCRGDYKEKGTMGTDMKVKDETKNYG